MTDTPDRTPRIGTGFVWIDAPCPDCGALVEVLALVTSVLTVPQHDAATVRVRLKAKPVDHECRAPEQLSILRTGAGVQLS